MNVVQAHKGGGGGGLGKYRQERKKGGLRRIHFTKYIEENEKNKGEESLPSGSDRKEGGGRREEKREAPLCYP